MIRLCQQHEIDTIYEIINDSARAYEGHIPADRYAVPYMPKDKLVWEIGDGVEFYGYEVEGRLVAVMGIQDKGPVTLIRHAYVCSDRQHQGIGQKLLSTLRRQTHRPLLIGTWADAEWAIRFYQKQGFSLVTRKEKNRLLEKYWTISARQVETSVVLADKKWFDIN